MVKIEEKGKVTFGQAFKDYFRGYVDFKGRTTRAGYWWMTLVLSILALIFYIVIVGKAVSAILAAEYFETYDFCTCFMVSFIITNVGNVCTSLS